MNLVFSAGSWSGTQTIEVSQEWLDREVRLYRWGNGKIWFGPTSRYPVNDGLRWSEAGAMNRR